MTAFVLALIVLAGQSPAADREPGGTGEIRGRVTDSTTGRPLPRAHVSVFEETLHVNRFAITDDSGGFRFTALPEGHYGGFVTPGEYRGTHLYQSLVPVPRGTRLGPIAVGTGETRVINVALQRARAMTVRVVDPDGDPLSGVRVTVAAAATGSIQASSFQRMTDDRGMLRVFGIGPGRYHVCAETEIRSNSERAARELLVRTCAPAATDEARADTIAVDTADVDGIEIRMQRGRTFTISGRVVDAAGAPAPITSIALSRHDRNGSSGTDARLRGDGTFVLYNVQVGDYTLQASIGSPDQLNPGRAEQSSYVPLRIDGDIDNVLVAMQRTIDVPGRMIMEDPSARLPGAQGSGLMFGFRLLDDPLPSAPSTRHAIVRDDRTFTFEGLFGRRTFQALNAPEGWFVKSVRYRGQDILDDVVDFSARGEPGELEVLLSRRGAMIDGRVLDSAGKPVPAGQVWIVRLHDDPRRMAIAGYVTPSETGTYHFGPLRDGDYAIVALATGPYAHSIDSLARLVEMGERVTLGEFDQRSIDLVMRKDKER